MNLNKQLSLQVTSYLKTYNHMDTFLNLMQLENGNTNHVQSHSVSVKMILVSNIFTNKTSTISYILFNNITSYLLSGKVNIIVGSIFNGITKTIMLMSQCQIIFHQSSKDFNIQKLHQHTLLKSHFVHTIRLGK